MHRIQWLANRFVCFLVTLWSLKLRWPQRFHSGISFLSLRGYSSKKRSSSEGSFCRKCSKLKTTYHDFIYLCWLKMFCKRLTVLPFLSHSLINHLSYYVDSISEIHRTFFFGIYWFSIIQQTWFHGRLPAFQMPKKVGHLKNKYWLWLGLDIETYSWITEEPG